MKVLTDYEQLVGKTIAFAHVSQFYDKTTLVTTDNEILMTAFDYNGFAEEGEIRIMTALQVLSELKGDDGRYLREELSKLGLVDLEEYEREREQKRLEEQKKRKEQQVKQDLEQLAKLKAMYEPEEQNSSKRGKKK